MIPHQTSQYFDLQGFRHSGLFKGTERVWESLEQIKGYLAIQSLGRIEGEVSDQAYLIDSHLISIGRGTIVEPGAYIKGPCILGENCHVRHGAYIRGNLIAGDGCVVGHSTEVKNAIFFNGAKAGHFAYVGDSILGSRVNLGAGAKLANLRLDNGNVQVAGEDTGLRKFGAILGDDVQLGCNSVTNPGTLVGKKGGCHPCVVLRGVVPPGEIVR